MNYSKKAESTELRNIILTQFDLGNICANVPLGTLK